MQLNTRLQDGVIFGWFSFQDKTGFTQPLEASPWHTRACTRLHKEHQPQQYLNQAAHSSTGAKPHHNPSLSQVCWTWVCFSELASASSSSSCNYVSMKSSEFPCLLFILHSSLDAGSSWSWCPDVCLYLTSFFCHSHSFCIQTSLLTLCTPISPSPPNLSATECGENVFSVFYSFNSDIH